MEVEKQGDIPSYEVGVGWIQVSVTVMTRDGVTVVVATPLVVTVVTSVLERPFSKSWCRSYMTEKTYTISKDPVNLVHGCRVIVGGMIVAASQLVGITWRSWSGRIPARLGGSVVALLMQLRDVGV
jgi:hypothetical protein